MKKKLISLFTMCVISGLTYAQQQCSDLNTDFNCFTIVVGKDLTVDGSIMFSHNEDDTGEQFLNWYIVDRETHALDDKFSFYRGGSIQQAPVTNKYLWLELPKMEVSDTYLNEHGVAIGSNGCPSKEDVEDYTDGGILFELRRILAERATSASHAVDLIGQLVEKYGYADTGRSYTVADKDEAWIVSVMRGRRWVAARIPSDAIMVIPNNYVIDKIDMDDTENFRGSKDLVSYAIERGWYNPEEDGEFSFKKAYTKPGSYTHPDNIRRKWGALYKLTGEKYPFNQDSLPFLVKPNRKIALEDLFEIHSYHFEETEQFHRIKKPDFKGHCPGICHDGTQYCSIAHLRDGMPTEIGALMWIAPYHPCSKVFIPWYSGMTKVPEGLSRYDSAQEALDKHMSDITDFRKNSPNHRYWRYVDSTEAINDDYEANILDYRKYKAKLQKEIMKSQKKFEAKALKVTDKDELAEMLNAYTQKWIDREEF
ncbi:MAG: C69 family dipeptidase [Rikenellaceae bacterium]